MLPRSYQKKDTISLFTHTEKIILFHLAIAVVIAGCWYFIPKNVPPKNGESIQPVPEIPLLPPSVVDKISSSDVFLTVWRNNKFVKFSELESHRFDNTKSTVVLVHGLFGSAAEGWLVSMASRIVNVKPETEILAVDWSKSALHGVGYSWRILIDDVIDAYRQFPTSDDIANFDWWANITGLNLSQQMLDVANVVGDIPPVAADAAKQLFSETGLNLQPDRTHIIGFSHGAHVGGLIGSETNGKLRRLTVLDPSTRLVHFRELNRFGTGWDSQSAQFTDMYQTSYWVGTGKAYGHKTFDVRERGTEGIRLPPSPPEDARRHNYAPIWFASTIGKEYLDYGYSMTIPDNAQFQDGSWTGTIVDSFSENHNGTN